MRCLSAWPPVVLEPKGQCGGPGGGSVLVLLRGVWVELLALPHNLVGAALLVMSCCVKQFTQQFTQQITQQFTQLSVNAKVDCGGRAFHAPCVSHAPACHICVLPLSFVLFKANTSIYC